MNVPETVQNTYEAYATGHRYVGIPADVDLYFKEDTFYVSYQGQDYSEEEIKRSIDQ